MTGAELLAGGVSRHGARCTCRSCRPPAEPAPPPAYVDTRPRHDFRLPDGAAVAIIFDHDQAVPATLEFQLAGGKIVTATRVDSTGPFPGEPVQAPAVLAGRAVTAPMPVAPTRLPAVAYPAARTVEEFDDEYLLDVAAAAVVDSWPLTANRDAIEGICALLGDRDCKLTDANHRITELERQLVEARALLADRNAEIRDTTRRLHNATMGRAAATCRELERELGHDADDDTVVVDMAAVA